MFEWYIDMVVEDMKYKKKSWMPLFIHQQIVIWKLKSKIREFEKNEKKMQP